MRIGIDARLWNETGVGRYIRNLVWQLARIDKKNDYVLFVSKGAVISDLDSNFSLIETSIRWHTLEEQVQFPKILEKEHLDLVHFPYFSVPIYYKKPFVITIHDLIINHYPTGKASTLPFPMYHIKHFGYQFVMKQAAKKAQKILTVSEATKSEIVDHLNIAKEKVVVTYEGIDPLLQSSTKSKSEKPEGNYFLYVGNAYPHKNLDLLIETYKKFHDADKNVKLVFVGKEDFFYKRTKQEVHKMQLDDSVIFLGSVTDQALSGLYAHATALIAPSLMEGFGLPPLEAMAQNCLVIASDIDAHREICGEAALYFSPLNRESLLDILTEVSQSKKQKYQTNIQKGSERIKKFSWEKMAKQTLDIYNSTF